MTLIDKSMLADLLNVAKTATEFVSDQVVDIVNQALNYALFEATISLLGTLSLYLAYYVIHKLMVGAEEANKIEGTEKGLKTANSIKTLRFILLTVFSLVVIYRSSHTVLTIGKIMIAPKVYLLEEGAKILDKVRNNQASK